MKKLIYYILIALSINLLGQKNSFDFNHFYRYQKTNFHDGLYHDYNTTKQNTYRGAIGVNFTIPIKKFLLSRLLNLDDPSEILSIMLNEARRS